MRLKDTLRGMGIGLLIATALFFFLEGKKNVLSDEEIIKRARELGMFKAEELAEKKLDALKEEMEEEKEPVKKLRNVSVSEEKAEGKEAATPSNEEGGGEKTGEAGTQKAETGDEGKKEAGVTTENSLPSGEEGGHKGEEAEKLSTEEANPAPEEGNPTEATASGETRPAEAGTPEEGKSAETTASGETKPAETEATAETKPAETEGVKPAGELKSFTYRVIPGSSAVRLCKDLQNMGLIKDADDFNKFLALHDYARKIRQGTFTFYENESYRDIAEKLISREINP